MGKIWAPPSNYSLFGGYTKYWWLDKNVNPVLARSLFSTLFLLGTLIGLIGSTIILIATKQKAIRLGKITTAFIQHVAVLDLLTTLVVLFPTCLAAITDHWLLGKQFCAFQAYSRWFLVAATALLITAVNCSKLASILFPFRSARWTCRQGHIIACCIWAFSLALDLIFVLQKDKIDVLYYKRQLSCDMRISDQLSIKGAYTKTGVCAGQPKRLHREVSDPLAHRFHTKKISSEDLDTHFCNRAFPGWNAFFGKN